MRSETNTNDSLLQKQQIYSLCSVVFFLLLSILILTLTPQEVELIASSSEISSIKLSPFLLDLVGEYAVFNYNAESVQLDSIQCALFYKTYTLYAKTLPSINLQGTDDERYSCSTTIVNPPSEVVSKIENDLNTNGYVTFQATTQLFVKFNAGHRSKLSISEDIKIESV